MTRIAELEREIELTAQLIEPRRQLAVLHSPDIYPAPYVQYSDHMPIWEPSPRDLIYK